MFKQCVVWFGGCDVEVEVVYIEFGIIVLCGVYINF